MKPIVPRLKSFFKFLGEILLENLSYKITAILITLGLLYYVMGEQSVEVNKIVPLIYRLSAKLAIANELPPNVEVRLSGPKMAIQGILTRNDTISLDMTAARPGYSSYRIHSGMLDLPRGVKVTSLSPAIVMPKLEPKVEKQVNVKAQFLGRLAKGLALTDVLITPSEILVAGPESLISKIENVKTLPIDLSEVEESIEISLNMEESYPLPLSFSPNSVKVYLSINEKFEIRTFSEVIVDVNTKFRYLLTPHKVRVTLRAPSSVAASLKAGDVKVLVDLSYKQPGEYEERVDVDVPKGVTIVSVVPPVIKVKIWE